ncbi:MAG: SMP-30/gluconolactonase/LRE family protein [Candidatus Limnocylindria bacterium]
MSARVLLDGLAYVESPRWHDGRLWFAHWGTDEIIAVDLDGTSQVVARGPGGLGWSIDWLPDGRLLTTGTRLMRHEPDGSLLPHAYLSQLAGDWNELVVDGRGNVYVNGRCEFDFSGAPPQGIIALVTPDGSVQKVADGIAFPNGMVVTPDNRTLIIAESIAAKLTAFDIEPDGSLSSRRTWAEGIGADGICLDAEARCGPSRDRWKPHASGSAKAARSSSGSSWTGAPSPACSAVQMVERCSSWPPSGAASSRSTRRSPTGPARCWSPMRLRPTPAGRREVSPRRLALARFRRAPALSGPAPT